MLDHLQRIWAGPEKDPKPIIYLSGDVYDIEVMDEIASFVRFYCISYFYLTVRRDQRRYLKLFQKTGTRAFLDSGAFSYQILAKKKNQPLDKKSAEPLIEQYCDYIYASDFKFDFIVTFDYARDPLVTEWATKRIEARGLHPVPVYHLGTSITALKRMIDQGYSLIGIGGMVGAKNREPFLDHVFNLTEKHNVRVHGFGVTGVVIFKYPWFSIDSTTWIMEAMRGNARYDSGIVATSPKRAIVKNESLETRQQLLIHNAHYWTDLMNKPPRKPPVKKALF